VSDLVPNDPTIRLIHLAEERPIGDKRNFGCSHASGAYIAHWDDDDVSYPTRLADQIDRLRVSGKAVTGYHSMRFTDGSRWWHYRGELHYALGTSLCYARSWWQSHPFKAIQVGEDNNFVAEAWTAQQLSTVDGAEYMHATIHTGNTSPRTFGNNWQEL
jgi:glycosyltransferase involved in cell wall biosynthesis